jgi:PncC family amidohydrolase
MKECPSKRLPHAILTAQAHPAGNRQLGLRDPPQSSVAARQTVTSATPSLPAQSKEHRLPEVRLHDLLDSGEGFQIAAAESCTGGEVAHRITSISGSSAYFLGSAVTYANSAKMNVLGVPEEILESRGAVSEECALAMAEGATRIFGADIAVATTGIAGPGGATHRKPVGLVYIAVAGPHGLDSQEHHFPGDRAAVIAAAAEAALQFLLTHIERGMGDG